MNIVVGVNSYVDLEEADKLVNSKLDSNNIIRKFWNQLDISDKEVILLGSVEEFDTYMMLYSGRKLNLEQSLEFPRLSWSGDVIDVPSKIILGYLVQYISNIIYDQSEFSSMQASGVKSFADGAGARIEFDNTTASSINNKNSAGISKSIWNKYFKQYSKIV